MVEVCGLRAISNRYSLNEERWQTAVRKVFGPDYSDEDLVFYKLEQKRDVAKARGEAHVKHLFFFVVSQLDARARGDAIKKEISAFGWLFLSWHMANFSPTDKDAADTQCPLLAVFENEIPEAWPDCKILGDYASFIEVPPISVEKLRRETERRVTLERALAKRLDPRRHRVRLHASIERKPEWLLAAKDNLLFLTYSDHEEPGSRIARQTGGDDLVTLIPLLDMHEHANFPGPLIQRVIAEDDQGPFSRYAILQCHRHSAEQPIETISRTIGDSTIVVRRATFPMICMSDDLDSDDLQLSYMTAWIFEKPGKEKVLTGPLATARKILGSLIS